MDAQGVPILDEPATIHGHAEMTSRSQICSDPILILHFVLRTVDPFGSPAAVMRDILQPYKPEDHLQYHEIIFDFGTAEKFEKHVLMMQELVKKLERLRFDPERVEIIIYSHSETVRGDIWGGFEADKSVGRGKNKVTTKGLPVAYTVDDVSCYTIFWLLPLTLSSFSQVFLLVVSRSMSRALPYGCLCVATWYGKIRCSIISKTVLNGECFLASSVYYPRR